MRLLFSHVKSCFDIRGVKALFPESNLIFILIPLLDFCSFSIFVQTKPLR